MATGRVNPAGSTAHADLPPGTLVLLYTDGLIERPGEALDKGFDRLKAAAAECAHLPVDDVCAELLRRMSPPDGYRDDVVVLALRPSHSGPRSFTIVVPAGDDGGPRRPGPVARVADRRRRRSGLAHRTSCWRPVKP